MSSPQKSHLVEPFSIKFIAALAVKNDLKIKSKSNIRIDGNMSRPQSSFRTLSQPQK